MQALEAIASGKTFVDLTSFPPSPDRAAAADPAPACPSREIDPDRVLTPTEGRVSLLAAEGLSNQGIAARLSMSENTVKAHLQRVFRKLGIHSREELAARVAPDPRSAASSRDRFLLWVEPVSRRRARTTRPTSSAPGIGAGSPRARTDALCRISVGCRRRRHPRREGLRNEPRGPTACQN